MTGCRTREHTDTLAFLLQVLYCTSVPRAIPSQAKDESKKRSENECRLTQRTLVLILYLSQFFFPLRSHNLDHHKPFYLILRIESFQRPFPAFISCLQLPGSTGTQTAYQSNQQIPLDGAPALGAGPDRSVALCSTARMDDRWF
ncbi:uncharacterized protein BO66DRAFT_396733 [Aspergillus aculeatinus CBS 121060]|uniref:Uncharacterized protein n=1 Tax=Aspergillus aculeatinus CBS 121060 TaxID=1448322 RepID=A0ACD1GR19_9EURO|nr:hypothetical protein BO66DRAFT_396733 [Aspergillus aculeatinus CBS 121060]RAH63767.1 hypothetical protein BO66DRAFT_396733 [Aspergillus aculeatinus CBS 121060]